MPRLSVFIACSVDGYIATTDDSLDWLEAAARPGEDYGFDDFLSSVDALAMGRGTYNHIAGLDPLPFGNRPVHVFTYSPLEPRRGVTFWSASRGRPSTIGRHKVMSGSTSTVASSSTRSWPGA